MTRRPPTSGLSPCGKHASLDILTRQSNDEAAAPAGHEARRGGEPLPSGHWIGKFELRDTVHTSPTGILYRAWDRDLGMAVAVKEHWPADLARRLPSGDLAPTSPSLEAAYAESLRGFVRISRALAHCDHPCLVRVLQLQFAHGSAYRVMPWIDGEPLRSVRRRQARPPDEAALHAALEALLGALEALHAAGSPHGGVAADHILVQRDGRPVLLAPPTPLSGETDTPPWTDLRDLAAALRLWMQGPSELPGRPLIESSAAAMPSMALRERQRPYGSAFSRVIELAATSDGAQRLRSVGAFRDQLREARRLDGHPAALAPVGPAAVASLPLEPRPMPRRTASDPLPLGPIDRDEMPERLRPPRAPARGGRRLPTALAAVVLLGAAGLGVGLSLSLRAPPPSIDLGEVLGGASLPVPTLEVAVTPPVPLPPGPTTAPTATTVTTVTTSAADAAPTAAVPPMVAAAPPPAKAGPAPASPRAAATSPRELCGPRTQFSLHWCMQQQCERAAWARHPQCVRFKRTDQVD